MNKSFSFSLISLILVATLLNGCATDYAQQRAGQAGIGALVGAAGGALVGSVLGGSGGARDGAKIGAVLGAGAGWNSPPPGSVPQGGVAYAPYGGVGDACWTAYPYDTRRRLICAENARDEAFRQQQAAERQADREAVEIGRQSESYRYGGGGRYLRRYGW